MQKIIIRGLIALLISLTGVFLSNHFLRPNQEAATKKKTDMPMAKVLFAQNDVKKQGQDKIIWEPVHKGDVLYLGEKLKTSTASNAKIEFIENNAKIDIEADSLVVINKNRQKLSLQVVEGSLFVSNQQNADINLYTGNNVDGAVNIKNGDIAFSINKEGKANVDVIQGSVEGSGNSDKTKFKDLYPAYAANVSIDPKSEEDTYFKWKALGSDYNIVLEMGQSRNDLIQVDAQVDHENGIAKIRGSLGTVFWRLKAIHKLNPADTFLSSVYKVTYLQKVPPNPIYPLHNDLVQLASNKNPIEFRWNTINNFDSLIIEIYEEGNNTPILKHEVANQTFYQTNQVQKNGRYFWKISGKLNESKTILASKLQFFDVVIGQELQSPYQISPEDQAVIYSIGKDAETAKNIVLSWKTIKDATLYLVTIKKENLKKEFKVPQNEFIIPSVSTGRYSWSVQSINDKNEISKLNSSRSFQVAKMDHLSFIDLKTTIYYSGQLPMYLFNWTNFFKASNYQLKISQSPSMTNAEILKVKKTSFNYQIAKEGMFYAEISALDDLDQVMAKSEMATINVAKVPPPSVPVFMESKKAYEANLNGDISFELINYNPDYTSVFEIKDSSGSVIEVEKVKTSKVNFQGLSPGIFYVTASYKDEHGQSSQPTERKKFVVPAKSAILPPSAKGVRIR